MKQCTELHEDPFPECTELEIHLHDLTPILQPGRNRNNGTNGTRSLNASSNIVLELRSIVYIRTAPFCFGFFIRIKVEVSDLGSRQYTCRVNVPVKPVHAIKCILLRGQRSSAVNYFALVCRGNALTYKDLAINITR